MHSRAKGTADHDWPWAVFFKILKFRQGSGPEGDDVGSQNVYGRAEGIADHYWPWAVFFLPPLYGSGPKEDGFL